MPVWEQDPNQQVGQTVPTSAWGPPTSQPAGWYPAPGGGPAWYFDGRVWTSPLMVAPPTPHATLPPVAGVVIYVIVAASLLADTLLANVIDPWLNSLASAVVALVVLVALGYGPALLWAAYTRRRWGDGTWASVGWKWKWSDLGWGPLTWLAAIAVQFVIALIILAFGIPNESNIQFEGTSEPTWTGRAILIVLVVVIAPLAEEVIFRGVMLRSFLSRMAPGFAIVLQGVLFGAIHFSPDLGVGNYGLILMLSAVGCVFGLSAYLRRYIGTTIIAHAIFNGVVVAFVLTR